MIHALVRRIEIDYDQIDVVFRTSGTLTPPPKGQTTANRVMRSLFGDIAGQAVTRLTGTLLPEQNDE